jgi:hypothetical protein
VRLVGPVRGDVNKGAFLADANLLINLSVTLEESFPKTPVESLGVGVPVLGTNWNGVRDNVGKCGVLLPVTLLNGSFGGADVSATTVADGLEQLLADPPSPEACRAQVEPYRPEAILPRYRRALEEALDARNDVPDFPASTDSAAPDTGLLAGAAPLTHLSYAEMFGAYAEHCDVVRTTWNPDAKATIEPPSIWTRIGVLVEHATQAPLERFFAGEPPLDIRRERTWDAVIDDRVPKQSGLTENEFVERVAAAATSRTLPGGRFFALALDVQAGRTEFARRGVVHLERDGITGTVIDSLST